jgi:hypothetical protein
VSEAAWNYGEEWSCNYELRQFWMTAAEELEIVRAADGSF